MSDSEKAGTVKPLEDGVLREIVAPEVMEDFKNTPENENKARILGHRVREVKRTKMSGYPAEQPATILSDKAREPQKQVEIPSAKVEEILEKNDVKEASEDEEDDELMPSRLIALERIENHAKDLNRFKDEMKILSEKAEENHAEQREKGITIEFKLKTLMNVSIKARVES